MKENIIRKNKTPAIPNGKIKVQSHTAIVGNNKVNNEKLQILLNNGRYLKNTKIMCEKHKDLRKE